MAVVMTKKKGSPKWEQTGDGHRITVEYDIFVFSALEARLYLPQRGDSYLDEDGFTDPATVSSVNCEPVSTDRSDPHCVATVVYEYSRDSSSGGGSGSESGWAIETTGSTEHITHVDSAADQTRYDAENVGGKTGKGTAIGHAGDPTETPAGVDVQMPYSTIRIWKYVLSGELTNSYIRTLEQMRGTVNLGVFVVGPRVYQPFEVLYVDFSLSATRDTKPRIEFVFQARLNETGLAFTVYGDPPARPSGPVARGVTVDKTGWQYIEKVDGLVRSMPSAVPVKDRVLKMLVAIKVSTVYKSANHALLRANL